jgi:hypothetical protein
MVVFWWCNRGGLRGERGVFDGGFLDQKNTPLWLNLSMIIPFT